MAFVRLALTTLLILFATLAVAQEDSAAPADASGADVAAAASDAAGSQINTLIEALTDEQTRAALIEALRTLDTTDGSGAAASSAEEDAAVAAEAEADTTALADAPLTLVRQLAELSQSIAEGTASGVAQFMSAVRNLPSTFATVQTAVDMDLVVDLLTKLAFTIFVTYAAYLVLRMIARRLDQRLAQRAAAMGWGGTILLASLSMLLDLTVVALAWASGYGLVLAFSGTAGEIELVQSLYLNAFLVVQVSKALLRTVFSPNSAGLRLTGLGDHPSRVLYRWGTVATAFLGYGILLVTPVVRQQVGFFSGQSVGIAIGVLVILMGIGLAIGYRRPVAEWLKNGMGRIGDTKLLILLSDIWNVPVILYLLALMVVVLTRPIGVLGPMLEGTAIAVASFVAGMVVIAMLTRAMQRGVRLPERVRLRLPLLERRLNGLVPKLLGAVRLIVIAAVVLIISDLSGLTDAFGWLGSPAGLSLLGVAFSVTFVLLFSFLAWLALSSWVEYRLNPDFGSVPTAREATLLTLLRNAVTIALLIITLMVALSELGLNIAPLIASAGVLGLAIGFGAQKMVEDIITGVFIQFENAVNVGDVVNLGGTTGVVEKLTVRSVSLRDLNGVYHVIPFSSVSSVSNFMKEFSFHVEDMGIAYRESVEDAKQAMHDAFDELRASEEYGKDILADLEWFGVNAFGDSAVVVRARIKTKPGKQWGMGRAYKTILKRIFDERGIEIPFPHQTIYFGEDKQGKAPPMRMALDTLPKPIEDAATEAIKPVETTVDDVPRDDEGTRVRDMPAD
ncbi:small conductance mechanosensitive channel [Rubricella aquisinus]|uniref:Small conductance mechanosensitive channel n=1 Tax=Rubricella aquisinus TaxID=2028108 RepID=A0A840X032_9RHOB|nr:mechanosensitive ion channel domain-containing protein [Rubricella aquisinus]MBB5516760.1 small conductance mechanosensitive channel [Rubricella aquisinus]